MVLPNLKYLQLRQPANRVQKTRLVHWTCTLQKLGICHKSKLGPLTLRTSEKMHSQPPKESLLQVAYNYKNAFNLA